MIVLLIIIMLSATSEMLFSVYSLIPPKNAKHRNRFLLFLPIVLISGLFFTLRQGYRHLRPEMFYSGFHKPVWHDAAITLGFFVAAMFLFLIARYFVVHFSDIKKFFSRTFNKVRFYLAVMVIFISLSAIPSLGFLPTLSFLFFPGWIYQRYFLRRKCLQDL
jgi:hypothetical protein